MKQMYPQSQSDTLQELFEPAFTYWKQSANLSSPKNMVWMKKLGFWDQSKYEDIYL